MRLGTPARFAASLLVGLTIVGIAQVAAAATDTVTTCSGSGPGSLPAVVASASAGDTVTFSVSCPSDSPIVLSSSIDVGANLTIDGPGANTLVVSGNNALEVFAVSSGVTASISGLTIEDGTTTSYGGGGGIANSGTLTVAESTLYDDSATYGGGGISNENGSMTVIDTTFLDDSIKDGSGGGIQNSNGGTLNLSNSTFSDNVSGASGGGVGNLGTLTINDSTLSGNSAGIVGGGIYNGGGSMTAIDNTISHNFADDDGGGIANEEATVDLSDSTVSSNTTYGDGGGIENNYGGTVVVKNSTLWKNSGPEGGGIFNADYNHPGFVDTFGVTATIVVESTSGSDCSGTITDDDYNLDDDGTCGFSGTSLSDTPAGLDPTGLQDNGGPTQTIALEPGSPAIGAVNSASLCSTPDQRGLVRPTSCDIGAYQTNGATESVTNCNDSGAGSLRQVILGATPGATITFALSPPCSTVTLASTITIATSVNIDGPGASALAISGNNANTVFNIPPDDTVVLSGITIENGSATATDYCCGFPAGGGVSNSGTLTVNDSILSGNSTPTLGLGGSIYNGGTMTITSSVVSNSTASSGGGIFNSGSLTIIDSTLSGNSTNDSPNTTTLGGGIENSGTLTVTGSTISENSAHDGGGGISNGLGGNSYVTASTLSGNSAGGGGGAIDNEGTLTTTSSALLHNSAYGGGGIYNAGTLTVTSSSLLYNNVTDDGGAIETFCASTVDDSTLSGNTAVENGGAIANISKDLCSNGTLVSVTNSTVSGNSAGFDGGGGIFNSSGGTASATATIVANSTSGFDCSGIIADGGYNLNDDSTCGFTAENHSQPRAFSGLGTLQDNGGPTQTIALEPGSPAIGAVNSASLCSTPDERGVVRPTPCDIGAVDLALVASDAITSPNTATATFGKSFSFTVTTTGTPVPIIKKEGKPPKELTFVNNGNGTATIFGTPTKTGTYDLTVKATFGKGKKKNVVTQAFTLMVGPG